MSETTTGGTVEERAGDVAERMRSDAVERLRRRLLDPLALRGYFLARLPLALVAGLRMRELTAERCAVSVPYRWLTTNPFRSTYFAAQSMAAELSTGALAMLAARSAQAPVAMLIVDLRATFEKKADDTATFTCEDGAAAFAAVAETLRTGEGATATLETVGRLPDGAVVSRFWFTWSFKRRSES